MPCFVAQSFGLWHRALLLRLETLFFTDSRVQKHKNSAGAEFLDSLLLVVAQSFGCGTELWFVAQSFGLWHRALVCGTELCFCRLCNFDLPNKQRFSLQRHKSVIRLCAGKYLETC